MSVVSYGDDYGYANSRLGGSVVRTKEGDPVYVQGVGSMGADVYYLLSQNEGTVFLDDLDMSPVKLGYTNCQYNSGFTTRRPARRYKQGLSKANFWSEIPLSIESTFLGETIKGLFPSITSCIDQVINEERGSAAFSRNFCLKSHHSKINLLFRRMPIGYLKVNYDNGSFITKIEDKFFYLNEMFEKESGNAG